MEPLTPELAKQINRKRLNFAQNIFDLSNRMSIESDNHKLFELIKKKETLLNRLCSYEKKLDSHLKTLNDFNFPENFRKEYTKRLIFSADVGRDVLQKCITSKDKLSRELQGFDAHKKISKYLTAPE